ncbi:DAK2 domain-containing protein [Streptomyces sp. NPDC006339]|uniref:DAK2 domain-containing protein n=1 Tax=Streptomyces sp. NPDC006339 TaxID=3156755 RepID=UPI0033A03360
MPRAPQTLDAEAVRSWCAGALEALGREREAIDAINVYPVADGDTGTNLYLTVESAARAVEETFTAAAPTAGTATAPARTPDVAEAIRAMARGALLGACGNSGTILSQLLRGMAGVLSGGGDGNHLARAFASAAEAARRAVAHPVEGTLLTVADAAAAACAGGRDLVAVATAAYEGAREALDATPGQLAVLERAGVVDAGGRGLVTVLGALVEALSGEAPARPAPAARHRPVLTADCDRDGDGDCERDGAAGPAAGPAYEVIYLLEADDAAVDRLRGRLDGLGESLVVVGGDGLWNVHVHVDDAGAAVEAGVEAGRPYRIRITHFDLPEPAGRAVVAVVPGEGLAGLCAEAGATTLLARPGEPPTGTDLAEAIRRAHAHEVVLLPNDTELRRVAAAAAEQVRAEGIRVALIPTRAAVQGIAALAVHEPARRFDEDVVAMTAAAGATRYAELAVAERQSFTSAGVCQAGDVLGLIEGDVAVIGQDLTATARTVLDRMLSAGGELVTLIVASDTPADLAPTLEQHVRATHLAVDTTVYHAGDGAPPLLIGVE